MDLTPYFVLVQAGAASEILGKLLRNILAEPTQERFRRLRLSNKRIQESIVDVDGGVEVLQVHLLPVMLHLITQHTASCSADMYRLRSITGSLPYWERYLIFILTAYDSPG